MRTIEVTICSLVRPTERVEKVVSAIENIFPGLIMDIRADRIEAYNGPDALKTLHELLRKQEILDTARSVMRRGMVGNTIQFQLNKQAALMGFVSFPPEEEPLGSLHVQITGGEGAINWLAPETVNGVPVREIDVSELVEGALSEDKQGEKVPGENGPGKNEPAENGPGKNGPGGADV